MTTLINILSLALMLALVVIIPYLFIYLIFYAGKYKLASTFPESNTVEIVGSGSDKDGNVANYVETIANVPDYRMAKRCKAKVNYWTEAPIETVDLAKPEFWLQREALNRDPEAKLFKMLPSGEDKTVEVELTDALIPFKEEAEEMLGPLWPGQIRPTLPITVSDGNITYTDIEYYPDPRTTGSNWEQFLKKMFVWLRLVGSEDELFYKWVSLFGIKRIGDFPIIKARTLGEKERKGKSLLDWVEVDKPERVQSFIWKSARPIIVENVELRDGSRCHFLLSVTIQAVVPKTQAFVWKHRFYRTIDSACQATLVGWARHRSYTQLVRYEQTGPSSEFFQRALSRLNALGSNDKNEGFLKGFGATLVQGWIEAYELSEEDLKIQEASKAKELAERMGDAKIVDKQKEGDAAIALAERTKRARILAAEGERAAQMLETEGQAFNLTELFKAAGGNVDVITQRLKVDQRKANKDLSTLVEADAKTGTVITLSPPPPGKSTSGE